MQPLSPSARPLDAIRVVEFGQFIAAPGAAMLLGDLGAEVIKIESPEGDSARRSASAGEQSPMYVGYNRNKRSVALDLRTADGRTAARALALSADVVIQNARPGVLESMGLGADALRAEKPSLIYASITGFGTQGPSHARPGLDIAAQAESGMMSITGEPDGDPLKTGFAVVDSATALATGAAILAALLRRARGGEGETIVTSLLQVAIQLQTQIWSEFGHTGTQPARSGNRQPHAAPAADLLPVRDGHIVVSAYLPEHFRRLCLAIGHPALADDPRFASNALRVQNREALLTHLRAAVADWSGEAARAQLEAHGVVVGVVRTYQQVMDSPDVTQGHFFQPVDNGLGTTVAVPALPFRLAGSPEQPPGVVPRLGQHTREVLQACGLGPGLVDRLCAGLRSPQASGTTQTTTTPHMRAGG